MRRTAFHTIENLNSNIQLQKKKKIEKKTWKKYIYVKINASREQGTIHRRENEQ